MEREHSFSHPSVGLKEGPQKDWMAMLWRTTRGGSEKWKERGAQLSYQDEFRRGHHDSSCGARRSYLHPP
jgi:hypothetical protein